MGKPIQQRFIKLWEILWLAISIVVIILVVLLESKKTWLTEDYPLSVSIIAGLASGIIATIFVFYLQRMFHEKELKTILIRHQGHYVRTGMGQDNNTIEDDRHITYPNIEKDVFLHYLGNGNFKVETSYWDSKVEGSLTFDPKDLTTGAGKYKYIQGDLKGLFGSYIVNYDQHYDRLIVFYQHLFPRDANNKPDENRGWEIWEKKST